MELNAEFRERTEALFGREMYGCFVRALEEEPVVSIRHNEMKARPGIGGENVPWALSGRYIAERPAFTADPLFHAGCYYVQEASSMFLEQVVGQYVASPVRALDLCAAPGGKSTHLHSLLPAGSMLVSNEPMPLRAQVLAENVIKWGRASAVVTRNEPADFAQFRNFFDFVLVDAPCSGEGMFRKDEQAREQWSEDNVALCEGRQRRIIADVWPSLAEGGMLVYSTCTFNRCENDGNVKWISDNLGGCPVFVNPESPYKGIIATEYGFSLVPGFVRGEGQYCSAVKKIVAASGVYEPKQFRSRPAKKGLTVSSGMLKSFLFPAILQKISQKH